MICFHSYHILLLVGLIQLAVADWDESFNPITNPIPDETLFAGQYFDIKWTITTSDPVSLLLFFWGTNRNWILADNIANTGVYHWWVSDQIAYPTLVNSIYAGDPDWFEIHIYNGSFRNTIGSGADEYVGIADNVMKMNRGAMWFNITAPTYSVQVDKVVTINPTSFSTIWGGTTETFPITWSTVPSPLTTDRGQGASPTTTSLATIGSHTSTTRIPTFAIINGVISNWKGVEGFAQFGWVCAAIVIGVAAIL